MNNWQLNIQYWVENGNLEEQIFILEAENKMLSNEHFDLKVLQSSSGIKIDVQSHCLLFFKQIRLIIPYRFNDEDQIMLNGFQSWTETKSFDTDEKIKGISASFKMVAGPFGDYDFYDYPNKAGYLHAWTYAYILLNGNADDVLLIASLNEKNAYTLLRFHCPENEIWVEKDCEGWVMEAGEEDILLHLFYQYATQGDLVWKKYFEQAGYPEVKVKPATGWTSWYHYYTNISERIVLKNVKGFRDNHVPIDLFQIDDGWQWAIGDWLLTNEKFPSGLQRTVSKIHKAGYKAGLWLAPFICERKSKVFQNHKDWLLKDEKGNLLKAGINPGWKSPLYVLDFYKEEVRIYLSKVFRHIFDYWGFDMVKLDFLFAVAYQSRLGKTRGQIMYEAMDWLRLVAKEKIILGCGVPLSAAFGNVDYCRIGADIHLDWEMNLLKWLGSRERVSTILSLQNTIFRRHLNVKVFLNDPDVSILRDRKNQLSKVQRFTIFLINQIFGTLQFVSDDISEYDRETMNLYLSQFPFKEKDIHYVKQLSENTYQINFSINNLTYMAYCNLEGESKIVFLPNKEDFLYFHNRLFTWYEGGSELTLMPYESVCFLRVDKQKTSCISGSTGHLFPGSEVSHFHKTDKGDYKIEISPQHRLKNNTLFVYENGRMVSIKM